MRCFNTNYYKLDRFRTLSENLFETLYQTLLIPGKTPKKTTKKIFKRENDFFETNNFNKIAKEAPIFKNYKLALYILGSKAVKKFIKLRNI